MNRNPEDPYSWGLETLDSDTREWCRFLRVERDNARYFGDMVATAECAAVLNDILYRNGLPTEL